MEAPRLLSARVGRMPVVPAVLFLGAFAFAVVVLGMAGLAAAASVSEGLHDRLHDWALSESLWGRAALRMANASHDTESGWQLTLDFGFSAVNLGLAGFLFWLRPRDRTAPLLALGLVGTAAAFNLQAHLVYETVDPNFVEALTHDGFTVIAALAYVFALLIFPDGRPVPRWPAAVLAPTYIGLAALIAFIALRNADSRTASLVTVFGVVAPIAGVVSQAYRHQRPLHPIERQQSRLVFWALTPALAVSLFALATGLQSSAAPELEGRELLVLPVTLFRVFQPVFLLIPAALLVGIFRFRLWDVDKLISRALVYTVLAGFVSAVYIGVVVGLGTLIGGTSADAGNVPLAIAATFLVAVAFDPVKSRVQRLVNRLVLGARATPYEVLSSFAERMGESVPTDELLSRMARVLAEGTGALRADVWLKIGEELRPTASWATADLPAPPIQHIGGDELPALPEVTQAMAVRHRGELYGALSVTVAPGEAMSLTEEKLLRDLAGQAGLLLRNLRLTNELLERLEELKGSRQRLVSAQDEERRRLERNLHDGAQQQLVALKVHLSLAEGMANRLGEAAQPLVELINQVKAQAGDALEELRDLARGIYPPLLAAEGLPSALRAQARKSSLDVEVNAGNVGRYSQDVEAAVYFCTLEALQNASKYAGDCHVEVELCETDGVLEFVVRDHGRGYDPTTQRAGAGLTNMADRIEALGGSFEIRSQPGQGTEVRGHVPVAVTAPAATTVGAPVPQPELLDS
jgi:signal transduction histidine kinase